MNVIIGQSGGPTAAINASLYGAVKEALKCGSFEHVYGMINGIEGFMAGEIFDFNKMSEEELELMKVTPSSFLGSCRYRLPGFDNAAIYDNIFSKLQVSNIGCMLYIGGNDSMDTVSKLSRVAKMRGIDIRFIGIPKTIDNDLIMTDHTPGFGSAAKYIANSVREMILDCSVYSHTSVTIIEIMGRDAGWLTAASALARKSAKDNPMLIYLPEMDFSVQDFLRDVSEAHKRNHNVVVCVSEGIHDSAGKLICEYEGETTLDNFGHKMLAGCGKFLENVIKKELKVKCRSVEINILQRCSGFLQSATDIEEAVVAGKMGVLWALSGMTGIMVGFERDNVDDYRIDYKPVDVNQVCNQVKKFPKEWIVDGNNISEEFFKYAKPLIIGEVHHDMVDGIVIYASRV